MDKIINLLINNWTKGVDTYTHNGSTWLIFTEQKSWVIELTESKTLWYNYNFFKELFSLTSMDVVENQHYITKWVEDNIINKVIYIFGGSMNERFVGDVIDKGVKETFDFMAQTVTECEIDNIIQNGIKETITSKNRSRLTAENIIENGVKETNHVDVMKFFDNKMEDTLENGIKETYDDAHNHKDRIDGVIKNGVKETKYNQTLQEPKFKEVLKNGVIISNPRQYVTNKILDDTIQNGVKETKRFEEHLAGTIDSVIDNGKLVSETFIGGIEQIGNVNTVLNCGIKETKTPGTEGNYRDFSEWMETRDTYSVPKMIDDIIDNGEKINGTFVGGNRQKENVESVIGYGTKNPSV